LRILDREAVEQDVAVKSSAESLHLEMDRYKSGTVSYLDVITTTIALTNQVGRRGDSLQADERCSPAHPCPGRRLERVEPARAGRTARCRTGPAGFPAAAATGARSAVKEHAAAGPGESGARDAGRGIRPW